MTSVDRNKASRLGDRHLGTGPDSPFAAVASAAWNRVRLSASMDVAQSVAGQNTLWMLANLLARQFAVIHELEIAVPALPLQPGVALFGAAGDLGLTLVNTARLVAGTAMSIVPADDSSNPLAAEIMVGRVTAQENVPFRVAALGSGFKVFAGNPGRMPNVIPIGQNAFGPYFAACIGAGEVFKHLRGLQPGRGRFVDALNLSLWDFEQRPTWRELPDRELPIPFRLPPCYLIGAGAVGQSAAAAIAASGTAHGQVVVIDDDPIDETNLNRYPLASQGDYAAPKSELVASVLRRIGLDVYPYAGRWPEYASDAGRPPVPADMRTYEASYRYPLVLSCVDKNAARRSIQRFWPEYLIGGSTSGLAIEITAYDMRSPYECLACANDRDPPILTIEETAEQLRQLSADERRSRAEARGIDWHALEQYLKDPGCGRLGESEVVKFQTDAADWSVGFVSVASGTLLAAQLFKFALVGRAAFPVDRGNSLRFSFFNPGPMMTKHLRRHDCECAVRGREDYDQLWRVA